MIDGISALFVIVGLGISMAGSWVAMRATPILGGDDDGYFSVEGGGSTKELRLRMHRAWWLLRFGFLCQIGGAVGLALHALWPAEISRESSTDRLVLMQPMEWLTIGLVLFAGAQVWIQHRAERNRRAESERDEQNRLSAEQRALDRTYQALWAEHFRLESLASQWDEADVLELAVLGVLGTDTVIPSNRSAVAGDFAILGPEAGYLGGVALTFANDLARQIALLVGLVASYRREYPEKGDADLVALIRHNRSDEVATLEASLRKGVRELSLQYWDAISHSASAKIQRKLDFRDQLRSELAQQAVTALAKRNAELPPVEDEADLSVAEGIQMKPAALVATLFLSVVAVLHLLRLLFQVQFTVANTAIPMWASVLAVLGMGALVVWLWREQRG